jgi:hypothetical protein
MIIVNLKVTIFLLIFLKCGQNAIIPDLPGSFSLWKYSSCQQIDDFSPDINDCTKFYRCTNGYQTSFQVIYLF